MATLKEHQKYWKGKYVQVKGGKGVYKVTSKGLVGLKSKEEAEKAGLKWTGKGWEGVNQITSSQLKDLKTKIFPTGKKAPAKKAKKAPELPEFKYGKKEKKRAVKQIEEQWKPYYKEEIDKFFRQLSREEKREMEDYAIQQKRYEKEYKTTALETKRKAGVQAEEFGIGRERTTEAYERALRSAIEGYAEQGLTYSGIRQRGERELKELQYTEPMEDIRRQEEAYGRALESQYGTEAARKWGWGEAGLYGGMTGSAVTDKQQYLADVARGKKRYGQDVAEQVKEYARGLEPTLGTAYTKQLLKGAGYGQYAPAKYLTGGVGRVSSEWESALAKRRTEAAQKFYQPYQRRYGKVSSQYVPEQFSIY